MVESIDIEGVSGPWVIGVLEAPSGDNFELTLEVEVSMTGLEGFDVLGADLERVEALSLVSTFDGD